MRWKDKKILPLSQYKCTWLSQIYWMVRLHFAKSELALTKWIVSRKSVNNGNALIGGAIVRKINHSFFTRISLKLTILSHSCCRIFFITPTNCKSGPIKMNSRLFIGSKIVFRFKFRFVTSSAENIRKAPPKRGVRGEVCNSANLGLHSINRPFWW